MTLKHLRFPPGHFVLAMKEEQCVADCHIAIVSISATVTSFQMTNNYEKEKKNKCRSHALEEKNDVVVNEESHPTNNMRHKHE